MGRTSDARNKILSAAQTLIELRGYSALGVAEICKAAGVPKGSFYYFFDSKEALALAVIDEHWAAQKQAWTRILGSDAEPLQRLRTLFEETEATQRAGQQSCGTVSGCMFGNLTLEMSNQTESIRERLQEIFEAQVDMVVCDVS
ncbi:TetR/AcrR family transcriptional regulator, partial [Streptomyces krungchingensis]